MDKSGHAFSFTIKMMRYLIFNDEVWWKSTNFKVFMNKWTVSREEYTFSLLHYRSHQRICFRCILIYWNETINVLKACFNESDRHVLPFLCFLIKHCIFSLSYCTVMLRKLNHFDTHICFFAFVSRFENSAIFHIFLCRIYIWLQSRSNCKAWPPICILSRSIFLINRIDIWYYI